MARFEQLSVNELEVTKIIDKTSKTSAVATNHQGEWKFFEDFNYLATTVPTTLSLVEGTDSATSAEAAVAGASGVLRITSGDASGVYAADGVNVAVPQLVNAATAPIMMETRLKINTAITGISVNVGFANALTLHEPFSIATTTITDGASEDAVCFVFDDGATSKTWHATVAPGGTISTSYDTTAEAGTGAAPVADTYQILKLVVDSGGTKSKFYVNNVLVKTLTHAALDNAMYPTITVNSTGAASVVVDVDYIKVVTARV